LSPNTRDDLSSGEVSANSNDETEHCQTCVEDLCLRGPTEFHSGSPSNVCEVWEQDMGERKLLTKVKFSTLLFVLGIEDPIEDGQEKISSE